MYVALLRRLPTHRTTPLAALTRFVFEIDLLEANAQLFALALYKPGRSLTHGTQDLARVYAI